MRFRDVDDGQRGTFLEEVRRRHGEVGLHQPWYCTAGGHTFAPDDLVLSAEGLPGCPQCAGSEETGWDLVRPERW